MAPKSKASSDVLEQRRMAFQNGIGTSHWPYEFGIASWGGYKDNKNKTEEEKLYKPVELTNQVQDLIG